MKVQGITTKMLRFADNIILLANTDRELEAVLNETETDFMQYNITIYIHGEKFGGSALPTRRTDALNTRSCATSVWSNSTVNLGDYYPNYPNLGEQLHEIIGPAVLSQALSSVWGNQCPNHSAATTMYFRRVLKEVKMSISAAKF